MIERFFSRSRQIALRLLLCASVIGIILPLPGCSSESDDEWDFSESGAPRPKASDLEEEEIGTEPTMLPPGKNLASALGADGPPGGIPLGIGLRADEQRDAIEKKDIYWKLAYLKNAVSIGQTPYGMAQNLAELRARNQNTLEDEKRALIDEILDHLQAGLDADDKAKEWKESGIDSAAVPWGLGRIALENRLSGQDGLLDLSSRRNNAFGSEAVRREILDYETAHHAPPEQVKRDAWRQATLKIERLGEMLDLLGREPPENAPDRALSR